MTTMMPTAVSVPIAQDVVLVGGGHSHAIALQMWAMDPLPGGRLTLVSDRTHTPYSGMLPGHVAGVYSYDECHIDLRRLCEAAGAQFFLDRVTGLDPENRRLFCSGHPDISFDWLSLDIGSTPAAVGVPGATEYAVAAKPVPEFLAAWENFLKNLSVEAESGVVRQYSLGIVGGGAGGVELAISMRSRLQQLLQPEQPRHPSGAQQLPEIHLFQRGAELLPNHSRSNRRKFRQILEEQGIQVHLNAAVESVEPLETNPVSMGESNRAVLVHHRGANGEQAEVRCDRLFWVTNASAPQWVNNSGLATDAEGFVLVGDTLQSVSHERILAAGDIATMVNHRRPKAGVFAVRQGKPLFENLRRLIQGRSPQPFTPQKELLGLIGTGDGRAVASRGSWSLGPSAWLWQWKDRIDRRFMERFSELPVMAMSVASPADTSKHDGDPTPEPQSFSQSGAQDLKPLMYCSGCGAKVGKTVLDRVLSRIQQDFQRPRNGDSVGSLAVDPGIVLGLDAPDDAAVLQLPPDRVLIQTLDYFESLVSDPFIFGQITANHCLNDIFAMGATPHSALALVQVPRGNDAAVESSLYQLLSGAMTVLNQTQTQLIGGHTTEGNSLAFGLSCNGLGEVERLWRKGGMRPGDRLILTKPLGTGTLFAAQMRGQAKGRWIDGAIASMVQSQAIAVDILRRYTVTACTDVTGFGLLAHLGEMVQASGQSVRLNVEALPWLAGAQATFQAGIVSSLHSQNAKAKRWVLDWPKTPNSLNSILFDPQTSGGLLVALPDHEIEACLEELRQAGFRQAQRIGEVMHGKALDSEEWDSGGVPPVLPTIELVGTWC